MKNRPNPDPWKKEPPPIKISGDILRAGRLANLRFDNRGSAGFTGLSLRE
jgi:hypothetical protein